MKSFIIHRWDGSPQEPLYQWLKEKLEEKDIETLVPEMPNPGEPKIGEWVSELESLDIDEDTILIGHSIGCQTILRFLGNSNTNVKKVILIAPWMHLNGIEEEGEEVMEIAKPWLETPINFDKIKNKSEFTCIFSDNDPYVPLTDKEIFRNLLNAEIITEHGKGHFTKDDNVNELPSFLSLI